MSNERNDNPQNNEYYSFLSLSPSEVNGIIELIESNKEKLGIDLSAVSEKIKEKFPDKEKLIDDFLSFIFTTSILYYEEKSEYEKLNKSFPSKHKEEINIIIQKLQEKQILFNIYKFVRRANLENFGIPHLFSMGLMTDYRILNIDQYKEFIPTIICDMFLHERKIDLNEERVDSKKFTFQLSKSTLNIFISELTKVRDKLNEEDNILSKLLENKNE